MMRRSRDRRGGGVQPPPSGGGKSRSPSGRGLKSVRSAAAQDQPGGGRAEMEEMVDAVVRRLAALVSWPPAVRLPRAAAPQPPPPRPAPAIKEEPDDAEPAPSQRRLWLRDLREQLSASSITALERGRSPLTSHHRGGHRPS